jgi:hypothetical protein
MAALYTNFKGFGNADFRKKDGRKGETERILLTNLFSALMKWPDPVGL